MGYTTDFSGHWQLNKKLDDETYDLLIGLATTRRVKRAVEPKYGVEGEFYTLDRKNFGQDDNANIIDSNSPPSTQPGLWCQWVPTDDRMGIEWDGGEKFYSYIEWITYITERILKPRGFVLNGNVSWSGEQHGDIGIIEINDNKVTIR